MFKSEVCSHENNNYYIIINNCYCLHLLISFITIIATAIKVKRFVYMRVILATWYLSTHSMYSLLSIFSVLNCWISLTADASNVARLVRISFSTHVSHSLTLGFCFRSTGFLKTTCKQWFHSFTKESMINWSTEIIFYLKDKQWKKNFCMTLVKKVYFII